MKKLYIFIALASLFCLQSCDKFLDLKPKDIKVVSTIEDYRDLLAGYMNMLKSVNPSEGSVVGCPPFYVGPIFAYRSGELSCNKSSSSYYDASLGEYKKTAVEMMSWMAFSSDDICWNNYYTFLGSINLIAGDIASAKGDDERLRDYVKGEALAWRAFSYFKLLQYYAPYKQNEYGIPVYLKSYEDVGNAMPKRKTQTEVFKQILGDCEEVLKLLERTPSTTWNYAYEPRFIHGMLASIYCWKAMSAAAEEKDWENAILYADKAMNGRTFVRNAETYKAIFDIPAAQLFTNDEFYFRVIDGTNRRIAAFQNTYYQSFPTYGNAEANPDPKFYALYKDDDVRKKTFFRARTDNNVVYDKYNLSAGSWSSDGGVILLFRAAETQLIKAEALCRLGKTKEAKDALEVFKRGRYLDIEGSYTESDLLNEILKERKLEFYHEQDMWWLDMKRTGTRMERVINSTLYVLEPDDFRYSLPIPQGEMESNKNMAQNPGWDEIKF